MQILQKKLAVRIFEALGSFICGPAVALLIVICLYSELYSELMFLPKAVIALMVIIDFGICAAFVVASINILTAKIEYDSEKMVTRSFKNQETFYFKDIVFFGLKAGSVKTVRTRTCYWVVKTKEKTAQIDVPVDVGKKEFWDFLDAMKNANPNVVINVQK